MAGLVTARSEWPRVRKIFGTSRQCCYCLTVGLFILCMIPNRGAGDINVKTNGRSQNEMYLENDWRAVDVAHVERMMNPGPQPTSSRRKDLFVEFYTGLSEKDVDKQKILKKYNDLVAERRLAVEIEKAEIEQERKENGPVDVDVMSRLHSTINYGRLPDKELLSVVPLGGPISFWNQVNGQVIQSGSFLELGDCVTAFQIAADHPNMTVIALVTSDKNVVFCEENARSGGLNNFVVGLIKSELSEFVENLYSNPKVLFGTLLLTNLTQLTDGLLPHEMVEMLARLLSISHQILVANNVLESENKGSFFLSQWNSLKALLQKSCDVGGLECAINCPFGGDSWKTSAGFWFKVTIRQGARDLPDTVCRSLTGSPGCLLLYSSQTTKTVIQSADGKTIMADVNSSSIPLETILSMNPSQLTREMLFYEMLELPYPAQSTGVDQTLTFHGGHLFWNNQRSSDNTNSNQKLPLQTKVSHEDKVQERGDPLGASDKISQEEGVAKTWERVGDLPLRRKVETDSLADLEHHWQREEKIPVNGVDKEGVWSKLIERDHEDGTAVEQRPEKHVNQASLQQGEEPGLTRDEQELQKAIGYLQGTFDEEATKLTFSPKLNKHLKFDKEGVFLQKKSLVENERWNKDVIKMNGGSKRYTEVPKVKPSPTRKIMNTSVLQSIMMPPKDDPKKIKFVEELAPLMAQPPKDIRQVQGMNGGTIEKRDNMVNGMKMITASPVSGGTKGPKPIRVDHRRNPYKKRNQRHLLSISLSFPQDYINRAEERKAKLDALKSFSKANGKTPSPLTVASLSRIKVQDDGVHLKTVGDYRLPNAPNMPNVTNNVKVFRHAFSHGRRDHQRFAHYWRILKPVLDKETEHGDTHFNLLTFGGESQSLLGLKVASTFPSSTVVTVMSSVSQPALIRHRNTVKSLNRDNYLLLVNDMTPDVLSDLQQLPELFRFQMIGVEVFSKLISLGQSFLYYLGEWLLLARTTILEVTHPDLLQFSYSTLHTPGTEPADTSNNTVLKGMVEEALRLVGAVAKNIEILAGPNHHGYRPVAQRRLLLIDIDNFFRQVVPDCSKNTSELQLRSDGVAYLSHVTTGQEISLTPVGRTLSGVGLEFVLTVGPTSVERKLLFRKYLDLPLSDDMCPTHLVYFNQTLIYHPANSPSSHLYTNNQGVQADEVQTLLQLLSSELGPEPFSFMEYNSRQGALIYGLTERYKNSTFVSLQEEKILAEKLYRDTKGENLDNLVMCVLNINRDFTKKLLKSPDFLRYQYVSSVELLHQLTKSAREDFNQFLGELLGTSVTTFIQVPSAKIFSLAMTTFYPEAYTGVPPSSSVDKVKMFRGDTHPLPVYKHSELKFIKESARADLNVTIAAEVLSPTSQVAAEGSTYPWKVVRVDVKNLSVQVDHHFDYSLDGHSRKYIQHCESHNKTHYEVYLIREQDGFKIPYGNVYAISLIALLRIGLLSQIKAEFYDKFLQLPLYEDMAPWNIVFQAGKLDYIDYDSKDITFDRLAPAAYQVLAMLMNYERTIKDFGHCNEHASNQYQFKLISNCVGGSGYNGPCSDSRYPVPCGDHTCRSTFIECLQVLNKLEKEKSVLRKEVLQSGTLPPRQISSELLVSSDLPVQGQWSYNSKGAMAKENK